MHQRDYILRIIEQLGEVLIALRKRILGGTATAEEINDELARVSGQAGFDIMLLRSFTLESLYMFAAPGGDVDPSKCWLMAECLFVDGLQASREKAPDARASLIKARALYDLVRPGGAMLVGFPEAAERIAAIDEVIGKLSHGRSRSLRAGDRARCRGRARPPRPLPWVPAPAGFGVGSVVVLTAVVLQGCAPSTIGDSTPAPFDRIYAEAVTGGPTHLIGCSDFKHEEPVADPDFLAVTVPVIVGTDGTVEEVGQPRAPRATSSQEQLDRAVSLARSCTFVPATVDDQAVRSRATIQLRIARKGHR